MLLTVHSFIQYLRVPAKYQELFIPDDTAGKQNRQNPCLYGNFILVMARQAENQLFKEMWVRQIDNWYSHRISKERSGHIIFQSSGNSRNRSSTHLIPGPLHILFLLPGTLFSLHFSRLMLLHTSHYMSPSSRACP